eukprot:jgi/Tetstr1/437252/TSEL_025982.t1
MRHRVRRNWQAWADIGAGRRIVDMIRNGVRIPFKNGPPAPFNQGVSMEDATPDQLRFMDDELARSLASGAWEEGHCSRRAQAYTMRDRRLTSLLGRLGLNRHPDKGQWEPVQRLKHLGRAQFLLLAIKSARFYLRELHDVLRTKDSWSGRIKMTRQLRRDLEWWVAVPNHSNGRSSIYKPVETAYMHVDSSGYGWGAVLNETTEARGFMYDGDRELHITYKELKAVRYAVLTILSELRGRHVTTANIWADRLNREIDYDDWAFRLCHFNHPDNILGRHTIDRFATMENARLRPALQFPLA